MMDQDLRRRHEALRAAAADALNSALSRRHPIPVTYTAELHALHLALLESGSDKPTTVPDPGRYSLVFTDYRDDGSSGPYDLASLAAELRADLDADRAVGEHLPDQLPRDVTLTPLRAMVIGSLLKELAARLAPGPAIGAGDSGRALAEIAANLGERLIDQTPAGRQ
jgi:hypothetical protein